MVGSSPPLFLLSRYYRVIEIIIGEESVCVCEGGRERERERERKGYKDFCSLVSVIL